MKPDSVFGYARDEDVEAAITKRLAELPDDDIVAVSTMLGETVMALLEINSAIPGEFTKLPAPC